MKETRTSGNGGEHWMALEGGGDGRSNGESYTSRFAAIGASDSRAAAQYR